MSANRMAFIHFLQAGRVDGVQTSGQRECRGHDGCCLA